MRFCAAPQRQQLHLAAVQYADANKCTYAQAVAEVAPQFANA
jgi:hypothetical protein